MKIYNCASKMFLRKFKLIKSPASTSPLIVSPMWFMWFFLCVPWGLSLQRRPIDRASHSLPHFLLLLWFSYWNDNFIFCYLHYVIFCLITLLFFFLFFFALSHLKSFSNFFLLVFPCCVLSQSLSVFPPLSDSGHLSIYHICFYSYALGFSLVLLFLIFPYLSSLC